MLHWLEPQTGTVNGRFPLIIGNCLGEESSLWPWCHQRDSHDLTVMGTGLWILMRLLWSSYQHRDHSVNINLLQLVSPIVIGQVSLIIDINFSDIKMWWYCGIDINQFCGSRCPELVFFIHNNIFALLYEIWCFDFSPAEKDDICIWDLHRQLRIISRVIVSGWATGCSYKFWCLGSDTEVLYDGVLYLFFLSYSSFKW